MSAPLMKMLSSGENTEVPVAKASKKTMSWW